MVQTSKKQQIKVTCLNGKLNFWNSDHLASYLLYFAEYFLFLKCLNDIKQRLTTHAEFATDKKSYTFQVSTTKKITLKSYW